MEIFGIGGFEIALVVIIALVVAGPARMAVWARTMGQWIAKMRRLWTLTAAQLQRELDDAGVDFKVPTDIPTRQSLVKEISRSSTLKELSKPVEEIQAALRESQAALSTVTSELRDTGAALQNATRTPPVKPAPLKPDVKPIPPASNDFGTWGGAAANSPDLGSWSQTPADKEQS